ncbi:hypothetical protein RJ639_024933 [Escallonia herrerae]|uniref:5'-3' exoribonuclease n=2 Tax=Escallonia TaxID=23075 RepID=A0AA88S5R8_9ASTE|nr:hypothetical protein RJ639_024933 [Escallonia herrerae]
MGVPSFYRWLVNKYPNIVVNAKEERGEGLDTSLENPNGMEFDNLYLDMNGIIHPCFHPEDEEFRPTTFEEVFTNIFGYIDRLFNIVRPRKLLYLAIDGVAPRAKMNQQRSRRFRTSKDNEIAEKEEERLRRQFMSEGKEVLPKQDSEVSDSNIITPGTAFMYRLSKELQNYIRLRISNDPGWKTIKVMLSDANVPGEGEHKIMSFIRLQHTLLDSNPNTRHCLYGLDADLIMLALGTHEIHFSILREVRTPHNNSKGNIEMYMIRFWTHWPFNFCFPVGLAGIGDHIFGPKSNSELALECTFEKTVTSSLKSRGWPKRVGMVILNLSFLQFLLVWILREYLELDLTITNPPDNFEPDLERTIDDFIFICFFAGNDFLPHIPTLEIHEGAIDLLMHVYKGKFKDLGGYMVDMQQRDDEEDLGTKSVINKWTTDGALTNGKAPNFVDSITHLDENRTSIGRLKADTLEIVENTKELKKELKNYMRKTADVYENGGLGTDKVRLASVGWKQRFYPYNYGPFASDLKGLSQVKVKFQRSVPFKPFDQLMGVLPPMSAHALPQAYQLLMTSDSSNIIDFYPTDFEVDIEGKRFMWQGICKLPFIDEERLMAETKKLEKEIKGDEELRNVNGVDQLFVGTSSKFASNILLLSKDQTAINENDTVRIDASLSGEVNGFIHLKLVDAPEGDKQDSGVLCLFYEPPPFFVHTPRLLGGVIAPEKTITEADIVETQLWHEYHGSRPNNSYRAAQNQERYQKTGSTEEKSSPGIITKGVASGWRAAGRGKATNTPIAHTGDQRVALLCSTPGKKVKGPGSSSARQNSSEKWRPVVFGQGETRSFESLRISESNQGYRTYGRGSAQPSQNRCWQPRTGSASHWNNHQWRPNLQIAAAPPGPDHYRWLRSSTKNISHTWDRDESLRNGSSSGQDQGRAQYSSPNSSYSRR